MSAPGTELPARLDIALCSQILANTSMQLRLEHLLRNYDISHNHGLSWRWGSLILHLPWATYSDVV